MTALTVPAAPVWAQTVTAPGLVGQPACVGPGETDDPVSGSVSGITANRANTTTEAYSNLYSALRAQAGDGGPTSFPLTLYIRNAITNAVVVNNAYRLAISFSNQNLIALTSGHTLSPKTPYVVTLETSASGFGEARPLMRRCFMTGGTYTLSNESGQPGYVANTSFQADASPSAPEPIHERSQLPVRQVAHLERRRSKHRSTKNFGLRERQLVLEFIHLIPFPGASGDPASRTPRDPPGRGSTGTAARPWRCGARCSPRSPRRRRQASRRPRS